MTAAAKQRANSTHALPPPSDPATTSTWKLQGAARTHAATPSKHNGFICLQQSGTSHSPDAKVLSHYTGAIPPRHRAAISKGSLVSPRHSPWGAVVVQRKEASRVQRQSGNVLGQSDATVWTSQKFTAQPQLATAAERSCRWWGRLHLAWPYSCGNRKHRIALLNVWTCIRQPLPPTNRLIRHPSTGLPPCCSFWHPRLDLAVPIRAASALPCLERPISSTKACIDPSGSPAHQLLLWPTFAGVLSVATVCIGRIDAHATWPLVSPASDF